MRDERLNEHWFLNLTHTQAITEDWRREYNEERPHDPLEDRTPAEARLQSVGFSTFELSA